MTFSDAKECTFQPSVCTRMPNKLKNTLRDQYNWTGAYIDKKGSFEHFVEKFGKNFRLKPKIYRFGVYKQAIQKAN